MSCEKHPVYNVHQIEFCNSIKQVMKFKSFIGFFCTTCFKPIIMKASLKSYIEPIEKYDESNLWVNHSFNFKCPKCHSDNYWEGYLDPNITPMIAELNRKGYITKFCCEGHLTNDNEDEISCPYIMFKYPKQKRVVDVVPLIHPWRLQTIDRQLSRDMPNFTNTFRIGTIDDCKTPIRERMAALRKWVDLLPYCYDEEFNISSLSMETLEALKYQRAMILRRERNE